MNVDKTKTSDNTNSKDYCSSCGKEILQDENFCSKCGKNLNENMDEIIAKIEKDSKKIKRIKYLKNFIKGLCVASVPLLLSFSLEFMLDNVLLNKKDSDVNTTPKNEYVEVNSPKKIKAPFKPSDIKIEITKVDADTSGTGAYFLTGKITNNSDIGLKDIALTVGFDDGESVADFGGATVMSGKTRVVDGLSYNKIKDIKSIEILNGTAFWVDKNNNEYYTEIDFQLNTMSTTKW